MFSIDYLVCPSVGNFILMIWRRRSTRFGLRFTKNVSTSRLALSQGFCVKTEFQFFLSCSWQDGVNFAFLLTFLADKPDVYYLLLQILWKGSVITYVYKEFKNFCIFSQCTATHLSTCQRLQKCWFVQLNYGEILIKIHFWHTFGSIDGTYISILYFLNDM